MRDDRRGRPCVAVAFFLACLPVVRSARADEAQDLQDFVFACQRAGYERGDLSGYMKQWADDAQIVQGREERAGKYDLTLSRKQIEATRRLRFSALPSGGFRVTYESPKVEISGDRATLRVTTVAKSAAGETIREAEIYRLRRTKDGWRVVENRGWPLESRTDAETVVYDAGTWKLLDAEAEKAAKSGTPSEHVQALNEAHRFAEAHKAAAKLTAREGALSSDWELHGWTALLAGDADDAVRAFRQALKLDPDADVPAAARPPKGK